MSQKNFKRMGELLDELRLSMEKLEEDNCQMQFRMRALRDQNEKLRREREDLRVQNAQLVARIAQLSRKHSLTNSPQKPRKAKGPPSIVLHNKVSTEEIRPEDERENSDTDYEDTTPTSSPLLAKRPQKSVARASSSPPPTPPPPRRAVQFSGCDERISSDFAKLSSDSQDSPPPNFNKNRSESVVSTTSEASKMSGSDVESPSMSGESLSTISSRSGTITTEDKGFSKKFGAKRLGAIGRSQTLGRTLADYSEEEEEWTGNFDKIRPRVSTLAIPSTNPRRKLSSSKSSHTGFHRNNSFPRRGRYKVNREHLTYLSSDVEMKIQKMVREAIGTKYGGLERATKAAITIQQAYRSYCIRKQFTEIRKKQKVTLYRQRAESMKYPNSRRLSMIGPRKYRKEKSSSGIDPMQKVLDTHRNVTTRKMSPSISRRQLLNQSKMLLGVPQASSVSEPISEEGQKDTRSHIHSTPPGIDREPIEEPLADDVFSTSCESVDTGGITASLSADILDRGRVSCSPSIFSGLSVQTMQELFPVQDDDVIEQDFSVNKANIGIHIFNRKPTRGIQYLVHEQIVEDDPMTVARFICSNSLFSKEKIGEFVGEIRQDFNIAVLECMVELMDFSGNTIDEALRKFQELFRMPGEAQKIDKIMQIFAAEYFKHNEGGVIKSEDAAYVLAFAVMMLHTDLHNPAVRHHMTVQQWLSMNRGTNDDEDYPRQFLVDLYTRIQKEEFVTGRDHTNDVAEVERHLVGASLPANLCTPQRMLVLQTEVMEVKDINKRIMIKHHRRMFFLFNDMIMITKNAGGKYEYRMSISLLDVQAMQFSTPNYKHGICIQNVACGESYYCNCEKRDERNRLLKSVQHAIEDLRHVEKARIRTLGSTLQTTFSDDEEGSGSLSTSHELLNSITMSSSMQDMRTVGRDMPPAPVAPVSKNARLPPSPLLARNEKEFKRTRTNSLTLFLRKEKKVKSTSSSHSLQIFLQKEKEVKRTSKDSGFDSPNTTSPSPNGWTTTTLLHPPSTSQEPPPRSKTPDVKRHMIVIPDNKTRARSMTPEPPELHGLMAPDVARKSKTLSPDALGIPGGKKRWRLGSRENKEASSISSNSKKSKKVNRTASAKP